MKSFAEESTFDLNFTLIRIFLSVYETNSVKETADRLGVSQPSVSQHLEKLRTIYRDELFSRRGGKMLPTLKAQRLESSLRTILKIADRTFTQSEVAADSVILNLFLGGYCLHTIGPRLVDYFTSNKQSKLVIRSFDSACTNPNEAFAGGDALITSSFSPDVDDRFLLVDRVEDPWVLVRSRQYAEFFKLQESDDPPSLIIPYGLKWRNEHEFEISAECPIESLPLTIASSGLSGLLPRSLALTTKIYYDFVIEEAPELIQPCYLNLYTFDNDRAVEALLDIILATMRNLRA